MTLIKRSNDMFPTFFDDFFGRDWFLDNDLNTKGTLPSVNIKEKKSGYAVEMAAPGMSKKDFKIEIANDLLTISYEKKETTNEDKEDGKFTKREFNYQSFTRSFTLPNTVKADKIEAKYNDGILTLDIPKKDEVKNKSSRLISIS